MLKNISSLGEALNKSELKATNGGEFCAIHCLGECYDSHPNDEAALSSCAQECQRLSNLYGGF